MKKVGDEDYVYEGELGVTTVVWELYDISWAKFLQFSREEAKVIAPIRFIWYKEGGKEMKTVNYVFEGSPDDMFLLICLGKQASELEIFIEYDISELSEAAVIITPLQDDESSNSDGEVERPREEEEAEKSEDELQEKEDEEAEEHVVDENEVAQADIGTDVVEDAGDGSKDDRFRSVFSEGLIAKPDKEAYQNFEERETADREAAESDEECVLEEEADYPDTPIGSEEEWEQWDNPKGSKNGKPKFHVKPHVKKAPRGRPLKIKKVAKVPHGVGAFWSPYTDRPFEVFGNRVYDRSNLNPLPQEDPVMQPHEGQSNQLPKDD
ncbi:SWIM-type domain-containing protein [Raphanus sativus]|nr:SWIM-type domain-containing protein [Raphanus sativus]